MINVGFLKPKEKCPKTSQSVLSTSVKTHKCTGALGDIFILKIFQDFFDSTCYKSKATNSNAQCQASFKITKEEKPNIFPCGVMLF